MLSIFNNLHNTQAHRTTPPKAGSPSIKHDLGQLFGHALNALPGYSTLGANITNPKVNYLGVPNPGYPKQASRIQQDSSFGSDGGRYAEALYGGGGSGGGSGGGGGGIDVNYRNSLADKLRSIISAYDSLTQGVDTVSNDAISQYNKQYGTQSDDLNNEYTQAANQLSGQYGARGLADSSYYGNAQDEAKNTYNTNLQSLMDQRNANLAQIGQQAAAAKAGYGSSRGQYQNVLNNLNSYDQSGLNSLGSGLGNAMGDVAAAKAGQGTQGQFIQAIQGLPALHNDGSTQLQAQLQKLSKIGAPDFAKNQIAQGLINQQQGDQNQGSYWSNYWQQLMGS